MLSKVFQLILSSLLLCGCNIDTPIRRLQTHQTQREIRVNGGIKWKHALGRSMETTSTSKSRLKTRTGGSSSRKTIVVDKMTDKTPEPSWNPTPKEFWSAMTPLRLARRFVVLLNNTAYVDWICRSNQKGSWMDNLYYEANSNPLVAQSLADEIMATFLDPTQIDKATASVIMWKLEESCSQKDVSPIASYLWDRLYHYHKEERQYGFTRDVSALSHPEEYIFGGSFGFARIDTVVAITNPDGVWVKDDVISALSPYARDFSQEMWDDWGFWFGNKKRPVFKKQNILSDFTGVVYTLQDFVSLLTFVRVTETGFVIPTPLYVRDAMKDGTLVLNLP